ncbi:putative ABC transport system permease protein [Granulicatella balaenopterae]|uniref:Putative ABC transport system permease protein n=1 Tax=Granulicatella balaenopterae TaxID=137733 RepID=A0A1H9HDS3_9LACT|nr:ABC transporter permease [Granulicatella balaenopterae]SEQ60434.1 putative ABC transport system permease protein [Granulicatella balaenopterae]
MFQFISQLALTNLRKNKVIYLPFALAVGAMSSLIYLFASLLNNSSLQNGFGGQTIKMTLNLGYTVVQIAAFLIVMYANSFALKRRTKEFGLYSILGLEKRQIQLVMMMEQVYFAFSSVVLGLVLGMLFDRFLYATLVKLMALDTFSYEMHFDSVLKVLVTMAVTFLVTILYNAFYIQRVKAIDLMKSQKKAEKKGHFLVLRTVIGLAILLGAYYLAQSMENPLMALNLFFTAVILVVIATYILFDVGSITFINFLKKRKSYYYQPKNFIALSNLAFRMRKNAMGLASICVLSTMVLLTLSTVTALQYGVGKAVNQMFPYENVWQETARNYLVEPDYREEIEDEVSQLISEAGFSVEEDTALWSVNLYGNQAGEVLQADEASANTMPDLALSLISTKDYNHFSQTSITLQPGEVALAVMPKQTTFSQISFLTETVPVAQTVDGTALVQQFPALQTAVVKDHYFIVTNNLDELVKTYLDEEFSPQYFYSWTTTNGITDAEQKAEYQAYHALVPEDKSLCYRNKYEMKSALFELYGALFFVGVFLSICFMIGTVLVIYYKQISEGYEDQQRFTTLQEIGLDQGDAKKAINRQVLIVFFLPLITAFLHSVMALKMVNAILLVFGIQKNTILPVLAVVGMVFALVYYIVYQLTSRTYTKIVYAKE